MENEMTDQKNDGLPCVSCGKPSDTCTTDDADMCWPCYGSFQATAFDNLKKKFVTLIRRDYPGVDLEKALDELASLPTSSDNSWVDARVNITTPESTEYRQGWERGWNACIDEIATRGSLRTTPEDGKGVILGYLHEVIEPDGQYHKMYSAQEESPWKHWKEDHQAGCRYKRTALFGATPQPEHEVKG